MYNVAIILFGESREYKIAKNIFFNTQCKNLNIDVYGHSWSSISCKTLQYVNNNHYDKYELQKDLRNIYNTNNIIVNNFNEEFRKINNVKKIHPYELHQWRSFEKAVRQLKKSQKKYDFIIITRYDIITRNHGTVPTSNFTDIYNFLKTEGGIICRNRIQNMCDLLFIGSQQAVIDYADNFTRNIINNNQVQMGFKTKWYKQTVVNNIKITTTGDVPGKVKWPFTSPVMVRYNCPHKTDINLIHNYSNYWAIMRDLQKNKKNKEYIEEYNKNIDYFKIINFIKAQPGYTRGDFTYDYRDFLTEW